MGQLKQTGTFLFDILEHCVTTTQSGLPQWVVQLQAVQAFDDDSEQWVDYSGYGDRDTIGYLCLFGKDGKPLLNAKQIIKAIGWSGTSFEELDQMDLSSVQIQGRMDENEYNGKTTIRLNWVDSADADPRRTLTRLDSDALKKLNAKFSAGIRELSGGPKPKSVPAPVPPKAPEPESGKKEKSKKPAKSVKPAKPAKPTPPKPPAKPKSVKEDRDLPETCTQEEAWEQCWNRVKDKLTEEELTNLWLQVIGDLGGDEMIEDDWAKVRDNVLDSVN